MIILKLKPVEILSNLLLIGDDSAKPKRRYRHRRSSNKSTWLKVGHGGTLDKPAEGVLVIGIGEDCKRLSTFLHDVNKGYTVTGKLGTATNTLDATGEVTEEKPWKHITKEGLEKALVKFQGEISQVPPLYSALKVGGKRLSDHAREASVQSVECTVTPQPRTVNIHSINLTEFKPPHFTVEVMCGSGTYMRSLVWDIGTKLGTVAHMEHLCRTKHGPFSLEDALCKSKWTVSEIEAAIDRHSSKVTKT